MADKPATTASDFHPRSVPSIALAVVSIGLCVLVEAAILVSRLRFSRLIEEFEMKVSVVTQFAISPFLPLLLAIIILAAVVKEFIPAVRPTLDKCNLVILLIGASCLAIYASGVFVPLMSLIDSLSS
jgi:predicted neutral ceramidase superfamily lipid hydrolase